MFFHIRNISKRKQASEKKHAEHCLRHLNKTACEIWSIFDKVLFCVKYLTPFFHRTLQLQCINTMIVQSCYFQHSRASTLSTLPSIPFQEGYPTPAVLPTWDTCIASQMCSTFLTISSSCTLQYFNLKTLYLMLICQPVKIKQQLPLTRRIFPTSLCTLSCLQAVDVFA